MVHDQAILYVDAEKQVDRADWVDAIRKGRLQDLCFQFQFLGTLRLRCRRLHSSPVFAASACQMDQNVTSKHQQYHSGIFTKGELFVVPVPWHMLMQS